MERLETVDAMRAWSRAQRASAQVVGLVPTMGALHAGHVSLIRAARQECGAVVVSIFVNPLQFDDPEDLERYPQSLAADLELCAAEGVDAVFLPLRSEFYPNGYCTFVEVVGPLSDKLCGAARPGHFRGVCTVVLKLFTAIEPDRAWFGAKDLQQALIVNRMVRDLGLPIELRVGPTVRDADGLALSSRNARLSASARAIATALPRGLELARRAYERGERESIRLIEILATEVLMETDTELDYADVIAVDGFREVDRVEGACILAAAVFVDGVRLIDHVAFGGAAIPIPDDEDD